VQALARHRIETPEFVVFEFELAGLTRRGVAWGIDALLIGLFILVIALLNGLLGLVVGGLAEALGVALIFLLQWGYFTLLEWRWQGQSVGKKALGLRVLTEQGLRPAFHQCLLRNLFRILDSLPLSYLMGAGAFLVSSRRQRLGDLVAGTIVVQEHKRPLPSAILPKEERYNSALKDSSSKTRARMIVPARLRELMISLSLRREEIEQSARLSLFRTVASCLEHLEIDRPRSLSDERFVLGVTAALLSDDDAGRRQGQKRGARRDSRKILNAEQGSRLYGSADFSPPSAQRPKASNPEREL